MWYILNLGKSILFPSFVSAYLQSLLVTTWLKWDEICHRRRKYRWYKSYPGVIKTVNFIMSVVLEMCHLTKKQIVIDSRTVHMPLP
jgi:hypothetical protein